MLTAIESSTTVMQHPNTTDQQRDDIGDAPNQDLNLSEDLTVKPPSPVAVAASPTNNNSNSNSNNSSSSTINANSVGTTGAYHPQFMFCGACTTCAVTTTSTTNNDNDNDHNASSSSNTPPLTLTSMTMPNNNMPPLMQLPNYAKYKNKYKQQMKGARAGTKTKRTMVYIAPATASYDDSDSDIDEDEDEDEVNTEEKVDDNDNNKNANGDIELALPSPSPSLPSERVVGGGDNDRNENHECASIYISNLTSPSQIMLIHSSLDPSEQGDGEYETNEIASACVGGKGVFSVRTYLNDEHYLKQHHEEPSQRRAKTVDVVFDPILISLDTMVKSLCDLGLDAKGTITQRSRTNHNNTTSSTTAGGGQGQIGGGVVQQQKKQNQATTKHKKKKPCRSSLHVEGICCASEVPQVTNILRRSSAGVQKVRINITSRMVYVDHDPNVITVSDMAEHLNREGFGATIRKDGGAQVLRKRHGNNNSRASARTSTSTSISINIQQKGGEVQQVHMNMDIQVVESSQKMTEENQCSLHQEQPVMSSSSSTPNFVESTLMAPSLSALEDIESIEDVLDGAGLLTKNKIRYVEPNIASRTIKVEHNPKLISAQSVADALMSSQEGGYSYSNMTVLVDGDREHLVLPDTLESMRDTDIGRQRRWWNRLPKGLGLNIIFSGIFWIVSLFGHFVEKWSYLGYFGLFSVLFGLPPVAKKAYRTIRRKHFDANCMMVTAALGAVLMQQYDEAASVSFLFSISEFLEDQATKKARKALDTIINLRPDHANLIDPSTGEIIIIPANELEVGSLVSVRTGDKIPSDGIVEEGFSQVDESSLTGESVPIGKGVGDEVSGGTINAGNTRLVIRTTSLVEDSAVSRLIRLVEESASNRSPTEQIVDAFARSYTPVVICAAILMCTIPWFFGVEIGRKWALNGLIVVVIACPCALTISTPVTYAAGLAATAQRGIIVKGGARLEALGSVKTIVFDKTGTLTEGKFRLLHLDTVGENKTRKEVLELLALMEGPSSHPLAATLVNAAKSEGVEVSNDLKVINHSILKGEGVTAYVADDEVYVGNVHLFKRLGFYDQLNDAEKKKADDWSEEGGTVGFIGIKSIGIIGMFCVADGVRKEAKEVVTSLINDQINVLMLTGDGDGAARAVAREVGIPDENVRSQFLPEDKLHYVASLLGFSKRKVNVLKKKELLLFCGDGVNDAPALSVADVGVAMGEGAALAMEMSDVTLMDSNLSKLLFSIQMGTKVIATVQENIAVSVAAKVVVIALTFAGRMSLLGAIAADVGVMLLVSINGMKLLPGGHGLCCARRNAYSQLKTPNAEMV